MPRNGGVPQGNHDTNESILKVKKISIDGSTDNQFSSKRRQARKQTQLRCQLEIPISERYLFKFQTVEKSCRPVSSAETCESVGYNQGLSTLSRCRVVPQYRFVKIKEVV